MFCFACRKPILRSHKRHVVGCYLVHDDCQNPFMHDLVRAPEQVQELLREKGFEDKIGTYILESLSTEFCAGSFPPTPLSGA